MQRLQMSLEVSAKTSSQLGLLGQIPYPEAQFPQL